MLLGLVRRSKAIYRGQGTFSVTFAKFQQYRGMLSHSLRFARFGVIVRKESRSDFEKISGEVPISPRHALGLPTEGQLHVYLGSPC